MKIDLAAGELDSQSMQPGECWKSHRGEVAGLQNDEHSAPPVMIAGGGHAVLSTVQILHGGTGCPPVTGNEGDLMSAAAGREYQGSISEPQSERLHKRSGSGASRKGVSHGQSRFWWKRRSCWSEPARW